jgi:hypothetical protein
VYLTLRVSVWKAIVMAVITVVPMFRAKQHAASRSRRMAVPYGFDGNEGRVSEGVLSDANQLTPHSRPIFPRRSNNSLSIRKDNARHYHILNNLRHPRHPSKGPTDSRNKINPRSETMEPETGTMVCMASGGNQGRIWCRTSDKWAVQLIRGIQSPSAS